MSCAYGNFQEKSVVPSVYFSYFLEWGRWWDLDIRVTKAYSNDFKCVSKLIVLWVQYFIFRGTSFVNVWMMGIFPTFVSWSHNVWVSQRSCLVCLTPVSNVWSAKQCRDPCSDPPSGLNKLPEVHFKFPLNLTSQWTMAFLTGPIMMHTQILVHGWGLRTTISVLVRRQT